jgi:hypothetical protein
VGANRPDAGVFGLLVVEIGDLVRDIELGEVWDGVFARAGVADGVFIIGFRDDDDPVCCDFNGWVLLGTCFGGVFTVGGLREDLGVVGGAGVLPGDLNVLEVGVTPGLTTGAVASGSGGRGTFVVSRLV